MRQFTAPLACSIALLTTSAFAQTARKPLVKPASPAPLVAAQPKVLVKPYIQPGNGTVLTGTDEKVICWMTDQVAANFTVEYTVGGVTKTAAPRKAQLDFAVPKVKPTPSPTPRPEDKDPTLKDDPDEKKNAAATVAEIKKNDIPVTIEDVKKAAAASTTTAVVEREQHYFNYSAVLPGLPFDSEVKWTVLLGQTVIRTGAFKTRATATKPVRFIAVGDMANGKPEQRAISHQLSQAKPDFMIALGDIVYSSGRASQYMNWFFPVYNDVAEPSAKNGAPIMAQFPVYPVIGNHDADTARLPDYQDAYAAYYFFHAPLNGPGIGKWSTPLGKDQKIADTFKANTGTAYPALDHYSFDYGAGHFVSINANSYSIKEMAGWMDWLDKDLAASKQKWKFVSFHQPAFHTSREHYTEQRVRLLQPIFEKHGVDVVFTGHVHNYQRSKPLRFAPKIAPDNPTATKPGPDKKGRVHGDFTLDETYDGKTDTTPEGTIHIVSGGGGAKLYSVDLQKTITLLKSDPMNAWVDYTAAYYADKHSYAVVDLAPDKFTLTAYNIEGKEVDKFTITKP